ncbi:MAG: hypothetical protein ACRDRS_15590, partial [Pseudonocardiaceae bacterium]
MLPPQALRSHARYGIRRAMAHAAAGKVEHACGIAELLLGGVGVVGSATIRTVARHDHGTVVSGFLPRGWDHSVASGGTTRRVAPWRLIASGIR